jgi:hypothetical protein
MLREVTVSGSFVRNELPVQGLVRFTPSRLWVVQQDGTAWACLAPDVQLGPDGSFVAQVTATDSDGIMWHYDVCTPAGHYHVYIPWCDAGWSLRELIHGHRAGPRAQNR